MLLSGSLFQAAAPKKCISAVSFRLCIRTQILKEEEESGSEESCRGLSSGIISLFLRNKATRYTVAGLPSFLSSFRSEVAAYCRTSTAGSVEMTFRPSSSLLFTWHGSLAGMRTFSCNRTLPRSISVMKNPIQLSLMRRHALEPLIILSMAANHF
jgi:hypothetical protein